MSYWQFLSEYGPRFLEGTLVTLLQFIFAVFLTIALALVAGFMKLSNNLFVKGVSVTYIELFRGTSLLVQLYWIFFVLPLLGITLEKFTAGIITLSLCLGAYGAELVRGAIQSVPKEQWEAAYSLSLSPIKRMWRIILPQALANILPAWGNLMIELFKATALVSLISVADLLFEARQVNSITYMSAQAFGTALIIYYIIARFIITPVIRWLEFITMRKMGRG